MIEVDQLVVRYGERSAVDGVSFEAQEAQVLALLGPNGAGKTTTVEVCEGYRRPSSGRVRVLGLDPLADHRALVARTGVMLQEGGPYPRLSARKALGLYASYYRGAADPEQMVELVGLGEVADTPYKRLSGGERKRLSLALALVGRPRVAFLDEPTAGVDPAGRLAIREVIRHLRAEGVCVLLSTHELEEANHLADSVVILDHGRVAAAGTLAALRAGGRGGEIRFGAPAGLDVEALGAVMAGPGAVVGVVEESPGEYRVDCAPTPAAVGLLTGWLAAREIPLADLRAGRPSLEDVFFRLTADRGARGTAAPGPPGADRPGPAVAPPRGASGQTGRE